MLNDAACFKEVYIICGYTDLRSGIDRLAGIISSCSGNQPFVPDTLYLFLEGEPTGSKVSCGKMTVFCSCTRVWLTAAFNGRVPLNKSENLRRSNYDGWWKDWRLIPRNSSDRWNLNSWHMIVQKRELFFTVPALKNDSLCLFRESAKC